jgi:hypothetical protein
VAALLAELARHLEGLGHLLEGEAADVEVEEHPAGGAAVVHLLLAVVAQRVAVCALQLTKSESVHGLLNIIDLLLVVATIRMVHRLLANETKRMVCAVHLT